jgi:acetyl esterase/lipase
MSSRVEDPTASHIIPIMPLRSSLFLSALFLTSLATLPAAEPTAIPLWPGNVPGDKGVLPPETTATQPNENPTGRPILIVSNVSNPTITVYQPDPAKRTGAAVLVCPGGGYNILAWDLEGTEVCAWLNSIGVTGILLKYRVPRREGLEKHTAPLQDAQRALGLVRSRASGLALDPARIGVLGFSAGGHLAAALSNNSATRTYPLVDEADKVSCRPDFCVLIYPAYLTVQEKNDALAPELPVRARITPPTFIVMTEDDPLRVETALFYFQALKNANVPAELHLYPAGGHGYGLRLTTLAVTAWPTRVADWLAASGWLAPAESAGSAVGSR